MQRAIRLALGSFGLGFFGLFSSVGSEGCRTPTQITVELRTLGGLPCSSLKGVAIVVARTSQDAEDKMQQGLLSAEVPRGVCDADGRTIGTLVVTPQDSSGAIIVRARFSDDLKTCTAPDYKGCIVARRSFSFIDHVSVTLPITLEVACVDIPCGVETSCRAGTCVSSKASCSESSRTCDSPAEPVNSPEGGAIPPDGAKPDDGGTPDSSADAPIDAARDPGQFGNDCPTMSGAKDCDPQLCCYQGSFFCSSCDPQHYNFKCLGRKHCNGGYCCANAATSPGSSCDTTAEQACTQDGNHYLCTTSADCPAKLPTCNGKYYEVATGTVKECSAN